MNWGDEKGYSGKWRMKNEMRIHDSIAYTQRGMRACGLIKNQRVALK